MNVLRLLLPRRKPIGLTGALLAIVVIGSALAACGGSTTPAEPAAPAGLSSHDQTLLDIIKADSLTYKGYMSDLANLASVKEGIAIIRNVNRFANVEQTNIDMNPADSPCMAKAAKDYRAGLGILELASQHLYDQVTGANSTEKGMTDAGDEMVAAGGALGTATAEAVICDMAHAPINALTHAPTHDPAYAPTHTPRPSLLPGQIAADMTISGDISMHIVQATGTCTFPWTAGTGSALNGGEASNKGAIPSGTTVGIAYRLSGIADGKPWRLDAVSMDGGAKYPPSVGLSVDGVPYSLQVLPIPSALVLSLDGTGTAFNGLQLMLLDGTKKITLDGTIACAQ